MAFQFLRPTTIDLIYAGQGTPPIGQGPRLVEGATYLVVFQIKDGNGVPINCAPQGGSDGGWTGCVPLCQFKAATFDSQPGAAGAGNSITNCPVPVMSWLDAVSGQIQMLIPGGTGAGSTGAAGVIRSGRFDIKIKHVTSGAGDGVCRVFQGAWVLDKEVTALP